MSYTESSISAKVITLYSISILSRVMAWCTVIIMLIFLLPWATSYIKDANRFNYINSGLAIERSLETFIRTVAPTNIAGKDRTVLIGLAFTFILNLFLSRSSEQFRSRAVYERLKKSFDDIKANMHIPENSSVLAPLREKLEQATSGRKQDRQELLSIFAETKKKLEQIGKDLAFLSIDVVDSTGMKDGEDRAAIEHSFTEYKKFVESKFITYGYYKAVWTPDGAMACFRTVDDAVHAARDIINGLDDFNRNGKSMKRDFVVRCGINAGYVYMDEETPLQLVSDRIIDIAGHMQKHALPNTVAIAKPAVEPLSIRTGFEASGRQVDGYEVYEWKKI